MQGEHVVIEESDSTGIEWPEAEGEVYNDEEVESVVYNRGLGRLFINIVDEESPDDFHQYSFPADDEDSVVTIEWNRAVGLPRWEDMGNVTRERHPIFRLVSELEDVVVYEQARSE